jgi:hypothetical protein
LIFVRKSPCFLSPNYLLIPYSEKGKEGFLREGKIEIKREAKLSSPSKLSLFREKKKKKKR